MVGTIAQSCDRCGSGTQQPGQVLGGSLPLFPPPPLEFPTFAARSLYVRNDARNPSSESWNCGGETVREFCLNSDFHVNLRIFHMPKIYDMGPTALLPLRRKACWGLFRPKNPMASAGFEPANLGTKGQNANPRWPKPLVDIIVLTKYTEQYLALQLLHSYTFWHDSAILR